MAFDCFFVNDEVRKFRHVFDDASFSCKDGSIADKAEMCKRWHLEKSAGVVFWEREL